MSGRTSDGGSIRILNVVDDYTRVALGSRVARSIGARDFVSELERLFGLHGKPEVLRSDNGREFIADSLGASSPVRASRPRSSRKAARSKTRSSNGSTARCARKVLNGEEFDNVLEARVVITDWLVTYNTLRPHPGLGMLAPAAFAASCREGPK